ncbi:glycoside hydrolase family 18 protein [Roseateles depolymerans]|uniref:chitinase n=1 Tax=Roseateles depolymerans TaxID=76731 RepID=A0A0U3MSZ2_9BURK|nr:glycoside hydrolase family 18 protein [Roseateles depolymerans]ALV04996.1 Chitinase [Roseateles depolymerans]REG14992.1 GH18 family chitinase [Roseateles depolymerans]
MPRHRLSVLMVLFTLAVGGLPAPGAEAHRMDDADKRSSASASSPAMPATPPLRDLFTGRQRPFTGPSKGVVGVYVPNWQPEALLDQVPPGNVTHVLYAFLRICGPGQLPKDAAACEGRAHFELATSAVENRFNQVFARYKQRAPQLQVLASVGGWGGSDPFFHLAQDPARREVFVASAQRFLREHPAFDGIDIDWEHPGDNSAVNGVKLGSPQDGQAYADLLTDLRQSLDALGKETGRRYLVTMAVNTMSPIVDRINFRQAAGALDLVFMMTYDFYGGWSPAAGHHSTLASSSPEADDSLIRSIRNLSEAGVPPAKMVAGVAMYGRGFTGVQQPRTGAAKTGIYPGEEGAMPYRDIAAQLLDRRGRGRGGYQAVWDPVTRSWSLFHAGRHQWMGYDDPRAVWAKAQYAQSQGLAGVFAWELSQDNGDLLNAMNLGLGRQPGTWPARQRPSASSDRSASPAASTQKESSR